MRNLRFWLSVLTVFVLLGLSFGTAAAQGGGQGDWTAEGFMSQAYYFTRPLGWTGTYATGHGGITYVEGRNIIDPIEGRYWYGRFSLYGLETGKTYSVRAGSTTLCSFTATGRSMFMGGDGCSFGRITTLPGFNPAFQFQPTPFGYNLSCNRPTSLTVVDDTGTLVLQGFTATAYGGFQGWYRGFSC